MGTIVYTAKIVKVGDSASVIIPSSHMKMLNLKIGKIVRVILDNSLYQPMPSKVIAIYKKNLPEITCSDDEINKFLEAQYNASIAVQEGIINKPQIESFILGELSKYGKEFVNRYNLFNTKLQKAMPKILKELDPQELYKKIN
ncbi:MAG: hypothetical protein AABW92_03745 [Nanoarchaeota archaeon]